MVHPLDNLCSSKLSISDNNYIIKELKKINKYKPKDLKMWKESLIKKGGEKMEPNVEDYMDATCVASTGGFMEFNEA